MDLLFLIAIYPFCFLYALYEDAFFEEAFPIALMIDLFLTGYFWIIVFVLNCFSISNNLSPFGVLIAFYSIIITFFCK